jgi:DNA-binding NarL/FixJ family response regulator
LKILILDDHALVASGVAGYLSGKMPELEFITAQDQQSLLDLLTCSLDTCLCIVDYWLDGIESSELLIQLRDSHGTVPVLVISGDSNSSVVDKARTLSAKGFVSKSDSPENLFAACNTLISGGEWFPELNRTSAKRQYEIAVTPNELGLTSRQGEVLDQLLQGFPNKVIAKKLGISESTVKEHVSCIFERLNISTRAAMFVHFNGKKLLLEPINDDK